MKKKYLTIFFLFILSNTGPCLAVNLYKSVAIREEKVSSSEKLSFSIDNPSNEKLEKRTIEYEGINDVSLEFFSGLTNLTLCFKPANYLGTEIDIQEVSFNHITPEGIPLAEMILYGDADNKEATQTISCATFNTDEQVKNGRLDLGLINLNSGTLEIFTNNKPSLTRFELDFNSLAYEEEKERKAAKESEEDYKLLLAPDVFLEFNTKEDESISFRAFLDDSSLDTLPKGFIYEYIIDYGDGSFDSTRTQETSYEPHHQYQIASGDIPAQAQLNIIEESSDYLIGTSISNLVFPLIDKVPDIFLPPDLLKVGKEIVEKQEPLVSKLSISNEPEPKPVEEEPIVKGKYTAFIQVPAGHVFQDDWFYEDHLKVERSEAEIASIKPPRLKGDIDLVKGMAHYVLGANPCPECKVESDNELLLSKVNNVVFSGSTSCNEDLAVDLLATVNLNGKKIKEYILNSQDENIVSIPLEDCGNEEQKTFNAAFDVSNQKLDSHGFIFDEKGSYSVTVEVIEKLAPKAKALELSYEEDINEILSDLEINKMGLAVEVHGKVVETKTPVVAIAQAAILANTKDPGELKDTMCKNASNLVGQLNEHLYEYFPLAKGGISNFYSASFYNSSGIGDLLRYPERLEAAAKLGAVDKYVLIVDTPLFPLLATVASADMNSYTKSKRLIYLKDYSRSKSKGSLWNVEAPLDLMHEISHALGPRIWSEPQMKVNVHNLLTNYANGLTASDDGMSIHLKKPDIMSKGRSEDKRSGQETYKHLLKELSKDQIDPSLILVRAKLKSNGEEAEFLPLYNLEGFQDLEESLEEDYGAIELRDSENNLLANYPFPEPVFQPPHSAISFEEALISYAVPCLPGTSKIVLSTHAGEIAAIDISPNKPKIEIKKISKISSKDKEDKLKVYWKASDPDKDKLLVNIMSSPNGQHYFDQEFEISSKANNVLIDYLPGTKFIKVIVTDGTSSSEDLSELSL